MIETEEIGCRTVKYLIVRRPITIKNTHWEIVSNHLRSYHDCVDFYHKTLRQDQLMKKSYEYHMLKGEAI